MWNYVILLNISFVQYLMMKIYLREIEKKTYILFIFLFSFVIDITSYYAYAIKMQKKNIHFVIFLN